MDVPRFQVQNLSLERNGRPVLCNVNMVVAAGEIVCLLGPSGSGKSSLLRCLNRLTEPPPQTIFLDGQDITTIDVLALRRRVGMVFQKPALFPGTVAENIAYGPQLDGRILTPDEIATLLALADLPPEYAQRPTSELSGGEAQRVSMPAPWPTAPTLFSWTNQPAPWTRQPAATCEKPLRNCGRN